MNPYLAPEAEFFDRAVLPPEIQGLLDEWPEIDPGTARLVRAAVMSRDPRRLRQPWDILNARAVLVFPPVWASLPCSDGMNDASITEYGVVRGSVHKLGYGHKQATAAPIVAGVSEAGDCSGKPGAGCVGVAGSAALRRERQSGLCLAAALPGRCGGTGRASLAARDSDAGSSEGGGTGRRERGDRDRVGRRLSPAGWRGCPGHDA